ncbi:MAG: hypothetical protein H0T93_00405, partial [Chloroflexia bacterium]|nr:hypothetical protein [Chloroflexia bacterium]
MTADTQSLKPIPERSTKGWIVVALAIETGFKTVIGLEVHAQVLTQSKMYCGCSADYA